MYAPDPAAISPAAEQARRAEERSASIEHGKAIRAFADYFHIDPKEIRLMQGRLSDVAPAAAREVDADLVVMGARNLSRFERFIKPVSAEPMLARAPCDLLIVRSDADAEPPEAGQRPVAGVPAFDPEQAILDPERTFGSPLNLAERSDITIALRRRILEMWQLDVESEMTEEDEGGPVLRTRVEQLERIQQAREALRDEMPPATQAEFS
jgi:hypothetical protein